MSVQKHTNTCTLNINTFKGTATASTPTQSQACEGTQTVYICTQTHTHIYVGSWRSRNTVKDTGIQPTMLWFHNHKHTHTHARTHTHAHTRTHAHAHTHTHTHTHTHILMHQQTGTQLVTQSQTYRPTLCVHTLGDTTKCALMCLAQNLPVPELM